MKFKGQSVVTIIFMIISSFAAVVALEWDFKTALAPFSCAVVAFILSSALLVKELKGTKTGNAQIMDVGFRKDVPARQVMLGSVQYFGWLVAVYIGILVIGMYPSFLLFVFLYLQMSRKVGVVVSVVLAGATAAVAYIVVSQIAQVALPEPYLYRLLF